MTRNKNKGFVQKVNKKLPFVSVCTPTFNRRPFIQMIMRCFDNQDYPKDRIEWIIVDDGTDHIEDLVESHPNVKYFKYDEKMSLGKKRNIMHTKSTGEIIVDMDDDDFYPPDRISHAVDKLMQNPNALCAGSSEMYIYFNHIQKMIKFGPYGAQHATAGTFAFKRKLLDDTKYNDDACLAEEREFLKDYTVPFVQLDPLKTILVFSHSHNTFDKRILLENMEGNKFVNHCSRTIDDFTKDQWIVNFFTKDVESVLKDYDPGDINMKPDVLKQIQEINKKRNEMMVSQQNLQNLQPQASMFQIMFHEDGKPPREMTHTEIVETLSKQQTQLAQTQKLKELYNCSLRENVRLKEIIETQQRMLDDKNVMISDLETKLSLNNDVVLITSMEKA